MYDSRYKIENSILNTNTPTVCYRHPILSFQVVTLSNIFSLIHYSDILSWLTYKFLYRRFSWSLTYCFCPYVYVQNIICWVVNTRGDLAITTLPMTAVRNHICFYEVVSNLVINQLDKSTIWTLRVIQSRCWLTSRYEKILLTHSHTYDWKTWLTTGLPRENSWHKLSSCLKKTFTMGFFLKGFEAVT